MSNHGNAREIAHRASRQHNYLSSLYVSCMHSYYNRNTGMSFALFSDRCEVVAAFTNPTLHRTISQRFFYFYGTPSTR